MSILSDLLSSGLAVLQTVTGDPFTIPSRRRPDGIPYLGTFSDEKVEFVFEDIGQREKVTRTVAVAKTQFMSRLDISQTPALDAFDAHYVINAVAEDQLHYIFSLEKRT